MGFEVVSWHRVLGFNACHLSGLHLGRGFLWVFPGGCCITFGALAIAGPVQPHTIHSAFTGSQRVWGKVKGQPSGSATNPGFVRVQRYNQLSYKPGLTVMCNKEFRCLMQHEKKVKNSDRSQSPAQTQIPKKAHPHPGGGGAWWPKMLKFGAKPPTHLYTHPPPPPGGGGGILATKQ